MSHRNFSPVEDFGLFSVCQWLQRTEDSVAGFVHRGRFRYQPEKPEINQLSDYYQKPQQFFLR